jgi:hypothetical protein
MSREQPKGPPEPVVDFQVWDWPKQDLLIDARGADVRHFGPQQVTNDDNIPDPVEAFVAAARLGMLTRPTVAPWDSSAKVMERHIAAGDGVAQYRIEINNLDPGALRVLTNLLRARNLTAATIRSAATGATGSTDTALATLPYPQHFKPTDFRVDYEEPVHTHKDRAIQLLFTNPPDVAQEEASYAGLAAWTMLLMLGGYPGDDQPPAQSGAAPDAPFLFDDRTIELAFPELFLCDELCFDALINWVQLFHHSTATVDTLIIR